MLLFKLSPVRLWAPHRELYYSPFPVAVPMHQRAYMAVKVVMAALTQMLPGRVCRLGDGVENL